MAREPKGLRAMPDDDPAVTLLDGRRATSDSVMRQQLDDANERIRRGQRRARYLMDELAKEVARNRELAAEIDRLRARVAELSKS
jgi:polyhydroxyalkanoate synthesis regulator phasin